MKSVGAAHSLSNLQRRSPAQIDCANCTQCPAFGLILDSRFFYASEKCVSFPQHDLDLCTYLVEQLLSTCPKLMWGNYNPGEIMAWIHDLDGSDKNPALAM